jgi:hypothetical protein
MAIIVHGIAVIVNEVVATYVTGRKVWMVVINAAVYDADGLAFSSHAYIPDHPDSSLVDDIVFHKSYLLRFYHIRNFSANTTKPVAILVNQIAAYFLCARVYARFFVIAAGIGITVACWQSMCCIVGG